MEDNDETQGISSRIDRRKVLTGLGAGVAAGVAGCSGDGETGDGEDTTTTEGDGGDGGDDGGDDMDDGGAMQGGRPTIGLAVAPTTLNPLDAGSVYEFYIIDRVMLPGVVNSPTDQSFTPWAVTDWTLNADNVGTDSPTLEAVTLRDDLSFNDGEDLTAEDLAFSIRYFREQNPTGSLTGAVQQKVEDISVNGDYELDIFMSERDQRWFTNILGFPILPQHIWSEVDDYTQYAPRDADEGLVGAGAWELADFSWENWFELDTRDDFNIPAADYAPFLDDEAPYIDGLRFEVFGSQNAMEQAVLNGEIASGFVAGGFTVNSAVNAEQSEDHTVYQSQDAGYNHISFNLRRTPFDDVAFRQFLNKAFDRTWVIQNPYNDIGAVEGDYTVIPAIDTWRPAPPDELASQGSYRNENLPNELANNDQIQSPDRFPDLSFPGNPGAFNMNESQVNAIRSFLIDNPEAEHDYSFGEAQTDLTTAPDGQELYVNGQHLTEAHTNNAGEGGQGPIVFSFQPPQEDLYQARYGQQYTGLLKKIGVPVEPLVKTINAQIPTVYNQEDFDMFAMGWGLGVNVTHFSSLYSSEGADLEGDIETGKFNPMAYTGADPLIEADREFMDFSNREPVVQQICAEIYRDAPTNITDVANLLEPASNDWEGWVETLGGTLNEFSFLNIHQTG